jgi:hypothetical protein
VSCHLGKPCDHLFGAEKDDGPRVDAEFDGIQEDDLTEGEAVGGGDPSFGVGSGEDDVRDVGIDEELCEDEPGGVIGIVGGSHADPEGGREIQGLELGVEIEHQITSPRRLI